MFIIKYGYELYHSKHKVLCAPFVPASIAIVANLVGNLQADRGSDHQQTVLCHRVELLPLIAVLCLQNLAHF
jgi:hypothetical protein